MTPSTAERLDWRLLLFAWALLLALFYIPLAVHHAGSLPFTDNDDSMRMVTATDLADGQAWQDKFVHRDDAPYGMPLHWSRLVDAPIALLIVLLRPVLGAGAGNIVSLFWPPLLLLPLLVLSVGFTRRMLGPGHQFIAILLPLLSIVVLGEFAPGRVDHHNIQILLTTGLVWATVSGRTSWKAAAIAGLLAATSIAIGIETLPFIVGAVLAFSLFWVRDPASATVTRAFAAAFALGTLAHFLLATDPRLYFASACDELSDTYVVAAILTGGAMALATLLGSRLDAVRRALLIGLFGALAGGLVLVLFPECRGGPYGRLDARAVALLLSPAVEAKPIWAWLALHDSPGLSVAAAPFIGLAALVWRCCTAKGESRIDWLVTLLFMVLAVLVMILQFRGGRLAVMPAIPAGVWLVDRARRAYAARAGLRQAGALIASWALFAGLAQFLGATVLSALPAAAAVAEPATAKPAAAPSADACYSPAAYARLASLPPGIVIGPMSLGASILRYTGDSVVSAGYHRNIDGSFATDDFLHAGEDAARAVVQKRGVGYVVACPGLAELRPATSNAPTSFVAQWQARQHWDWLQPVSSPDDALTIYKVDLPG